MIQHALIAFVGMAALDIVFARYTLAVTNSQYGVGVQLRGGVPVVGRQCGGDLRA